MQKCQQCNERFGWRQIYRSYWSFGGFQSIQCNHCQSDHKIRMRGRLMFIIFTFAPAWFAAVTMMNFSGFDYFTIFVITVTIFVIGSLFTPLLTKFTMISTDEK